MESINSAIETFNSVIKHPESFLKQQNEKANKIQKDVLEKIYLSCRELQNGQKSKALPKLITNGMDNESIWQQLELQNEENFQSNLKKVSTFLAANTDRFKINTDEASSENEENSYSEQESELSDQEELDQQSGSEQDEMPENESYNESEGSNEEDSNKVPVQRNKGRKSIVDDEFFKLSEMEAFLKDQDRREMGKGAGNDNNEEDIDYFAEENDDINLEESLKYSDFFDHDESDESSDENQSEQDQEELSDPNEPKSTHELKQERLKKKIQKMEEDMLEAKTWQMKGEIKAETRPQNSLLEEVLEFDSATRPAPIITENVSMKLEDIIKQRIKDKAFDDVERKIKPSDIQYEYKKQIVLDQEKSKQSLAQIYEKEYLKEIEKNDPNADVEEEEPKEHKEIRAELKDLFEKLDMLSNFHYTPRPAQPELKIITNLPTISMEEVAPVTSGHATMLAPEEIKRKPKGGNIIGAGERTETDKNRERRHKKQFQREKFSKQKNTDKNSLLNKVMKSRNVEKIKATDESIKSSSAFFSKLQDEKSANNNKLKQKRKAEKPNHQAKKFKL